MQSKTRILKFLSSAFFVCLLSACFNLSKKQATEINNSSSSDAEFAKLAAQEYEAQKAQENQKSAENTQEKPAIEINDLEIIWQIPKENVSGYIIHYGNKVDHLDHEISVKESEIEKFQHPKHGLVYRHYIPNIKKDEKIFVAISAYNADAVSEQSSAFEVK